MEAFGTYSGRIDRALQASDVLAELSNLRRVVTDNRKLGVRDKQQLLKRIDDETQRLPCISRLG